MGEFYKRIMDEFDDKKSSSSVPKSIRLQPLLQSLINELENPKSRLSIYLDRYQQWLHPKRQKSWSSRLRTLIFDLVIRRDLFPEDKRRLLQKIYLITRENDQDFLCIDEHYQNYMFDNESREPEKRVINFATWGEKPFASYRKWWEKKDRHFQRGDLSHYITQRINEEWFTYFIYKSSEHQDPKKKSVFAGITGRGNGWERAGWAIALHHLGKAFFDNMLTNSGISDNVLSKIEDRFGKEFDVVDSHYHEIMRGMRQSIPSSEIEIDENCPECGKKNVVFECDLCGTIVEHHNKNPMLITQWRASPKIGASYDGDQKKNEKSDYEIKIIAIQKEQKLPQWFIHFYNDGIQKILSPIANIFTTDLYNTIKREIRKDIDTIKIAKKANF